MLAQGHLLSASKQNLWRLIFIRVVVLFSQAGTLGVVYLSDWVPLPWGPLAGLVGLSFFVTILTMVRLRGSWPITEVEFCIQLGFDLLIHSGLLYYTGGSTNPFVAYYLVPLTIAAATLPWVYAFFLSGLALTGYTVLLIWYHPLHINGDPFDELLISLHLFGMWANFALSAAFITFFVTKMAAAVREQEELRATRREEGMRDQQLMAVATQAAGAAHELGTPLSTMSVLLTELRQEYRDQPALQEDVALLQEQVLLCRDTLQQLVRVAEADRRQSIEEQTVVQWFEKALNRWHLMRPEATYTYEFSGEGTVPSIMPAADLTQALLNLLNNAADACAEDLQIGLYWNLQQIRLTIQDRGPGVPPEIAEQLGKPFITTKGKGLGLGLFLSQASVNRAGGTVKLYSMEGGGTLTELCLPRMPNELF